MSHSANPKKLDELLTAAVDLQPLPDFAAWRQNHPEAVAALQSLPIILSKRRSKMIRIVRYSTSVALLLFVAIGAWWMFFGHGTASAWAQMIEQLSQVRSAMCQLDVYEDGHCQKTTKVYLEGDRVRCEDAERISIMDYREGKMLYATRFAKKATILDLRKYSGGQAVIGSNPISDLVKLKDAATKRQPDETIGSTRCHVFRVDNAVFLGYRFAWLKLWVDADRDLPVQVHTVVGGGDGSATMTLNNFHWNEPFDKDLLKLAVPKGYTLFDEQESNKPKKTEKTVSMQAAVAAWDAVEGTHATPGREIQGEEAAKILDMLGRRIEANYKAIVSWSGTYESRPASSPGVSLAVVDFFVEPGRDRLRTDYREIKSQQPPTKSAPPQQRDEDSRIRMSPISEAQEWRWVRTAEQSLRFPVNELRKSVEGFPNAAGTDLGQPFRILYREGSEPTRNFDSSRTSVDPRSFLGGNSGVTYWDGCSARAAALRGERSKFCDDPDFLKRNMMLRERRNGAAAEYVLLLRYGGDEPDGFLVEEVCSSQSGFNVISKRTFSQGHVTKSEKTSFRQEKAVYIPVKVEINDRGDRVFTLKQSKLNEPIDPAVFNMSSLGLRRGDRVADWIEHRVQVFDGKQFVPVEQFKSGR